MLSVGQFIINVNNLKNIFPRLLLAHKEMSKCQLVAKDADMEKKGKDLAIVRGETNFQSTCKITLRSGSCKLFKVINAFKPHVMNW